METNSNNTKKPLDQQTFQIYNVQRTDDPPSPSSLSLSFSLFQFHISGRGQKNGKREGERKAPEIEQMGARRGGGKKVIKGKRRGILNTVDVVPYVSNKLSFACKIF